VVALRRFDRRVGERHGLRVDHRAAVEFAD
jgi:hypothetical protein